LVWGVDHTIFGTEEPSETANKRASRVSGENQTGPPDEPGRKIPVALNPLSLKMTRRLPGGRGGKIDPSEGGVSRQKKEGPNSREVGGQGEGKSLWGPR